MFVVLTKGINQPPQNNNASKFDINKIFVYSPKKKYANGNPECSVLYPETSSDSASGRSKGDLFVSANPHSRKIRNAGNSGIINQHAFWAFTTSDKFNEPDKTKTFNKAVPIANSYEIIWAEDLKLPKKAYRLLLDHPDSIIAYTFMDDINKIKIIPRFICINVTPKLKGITIHETRLKINNNCGATKNIFLVARKGIIISFAIILIASAMDCNSPKYPTVFGPSLCCVELKSLRSNTIKKATHKSTQIITNTPARKTTAS